MSFPGLNRSQIQALITTSISSYYTISQVDTLLSGKSNTGHLHDDRYYTEAEIDALLSGLGGDHDHDDLYYTQAEVDTLLLGKASSSHNHDDRYFTESEVTALLSGKSDTGHLHTGVYSPVSHTHDYSSVFAALVHTHDDRYYTEGEVDSAFAALSGVYAPGSHNHNASAITTGTLDNARVNWASPDAIGGTTPAAVGATTIVGTITDTNSAAAVNSLDLAHAVSSGTPTTAFGLALRFRGHSATPASGLRDMGRFRYDWGVNAADASRRSRAVISVVEAGTERDQLIVTGTYTRFNHNGQSPVAYFQFEEGAADGRQRLIHFSDTASSNIIQARGGVKTILLGPATNAAYSASSYGMTGNIFLSDIATVVPAPIFGTLPLNTGTHKSFFISTPETVPAVAGIWTRTDIVDLVTFSSVSNTWGGTRPSLRHTALEHIFRTNSGTGQNNPGTDIFRVQDTGVRVESTLAFHLGDPTVDGTWRITRSGNDLVMQRRESGSWVTKQTVAA